MYCEKLYKYCLETVYLSQIGTFFEIMTNRATTIEFEDPKLIKVMKHIFVGEQNNEKSRLDDIKYECFSQV